MSNTIATTSKMSYIDLNTQDIPIFLRKTYHLVDTCDPTVCAWSDDGETFFVKNPSKFEKEIIPQFFKHNKFSSFVRQLNFYSFRKIKTNDSIRIDPELEKATANFWRFFHPKFQRGRPDLLKDIKRSQSTPRGSGTNRNPVPVASSTGVDAKSRNHLVAPNKASSSSASTSTAEQQLKSEVTTLKERIEAMNKNIDMLTTMVESVTLAQGKEAATRTNVAGEDELNANNKRSKVSRSTLPGLNHSSYLPPIECDACVPDSAVSSSISSISGTSQLTNESFAPSMPSPIRLGGDDMHPAQQVFNAVPQREASLSSELSDAAFVDSLFTAFKGEEQNYGEDDLAMDLGPDEPSAASLSIENSNMPWLTSTPSQASQSGNNRPRAELMNRLSSALSLLPRDIQELIVDRLIQAITSPKEIRESLDVAHALEGVVKAASAGGADVPVSVPQSPNHCNDSSCKMVADDDGSTASASLVPETSHTTVATKNPTLPLAAATLAALLSKYGKEQQQCAVALPGAAVAADKPAKVLPIPVHV